MFTKRLASMDLCLYFSWLISLIGIYISLYYGEIQRITPCHMCWIQRLCLFPIVILSPWMYLIKDHTSVKYLIPFALLGFITSLIQSTKGLSFCLDEALFCEQSSFITAELSLFGMIGFMLMFFLMLFHIKLKQSI